MFHVVSSEKERWDAGCMCASTGPEAVRVELGGPVGRLVPVLVGVVGEAKVGSHEERVDGRPVAGCRRCGQPRGRARSRRGRVRRVVLRRRRRWWPLR